MALFCDLLCHVTRTCLVLSVIQWQVSSLDPHDECRTGFRNVPFHNYPDNWHLLMDSYDYENLLEGTNPVWKRSDEDGDSIQWSHGIGGICQRSIAALDTFESPNQDNWVFTHYIAYDEAVEVIVNVTFRFSSCTNNPSCDNDFVTLYRYDTNTPNENQQTDVRNYIPLLGSEEESRLRQGSQSGDVMIVQTYSRPNFNGFYLALRDTGTDGFVRRIIFYYRVIPAQISSFLTCPEVPLRSDRVVNASCFCGNNTRNLTSLEWICSPDGTCSGNPSCACSPGYELMDSSCQACDVANYKPEVSNLTKCQMCPENSVAREEATDVCECVPPNSRSEARPHDPCTKPPSSPRLPADEPKVDGTFVTVCWLSATDAGGLPDLLHYNVYTYRDGDSVYTKVNEEGVVDNGAGDRDGTTGTLCYEVSGIDPMTSYSIVVTSANPATGDPAEIQDLTEVNGRFVAFYVDSGEGGLRKSEAIAVTFFVTLLLVAVITAVVVILVMWFVCVKGKQSKSSRAPTTNGHHQHDTEKSQPVYYENSKSSVNSSPGRRAPPPPRPRPPVKA